MRKIVCSLVVLAVCVGVVAAEEIRGVIVKVEGDKVVFQKTKYNKDAKKMENIGEPQTLSVKAAVKVVQGIVNKGKVEPGERIEGGLKAEALTKIGKAGVSVLVVTDDANNVTEIRIIRKKNP